MPTSIGYQDLAALIARQPAVTERWRAHVRSSAFSTIHATFSFTRPIGSSIPDPYFTQLAALDPRALDVTGSVPLPAPIEPQVATPAYDFPVVQRRLKGDRLPLAAAPQIPNEPAGQPASQPPKAKDQASLTPGPKPAPLPANAAADMQQPAAPVARKGDRAPKPPAQEAMPAQLQVQGPAAAPAPAPAPLANPVRDAALARAATAAEKAGQSAKTAASIKRKPVPVAEKPAPEKSGPAPVQKTEKPAALATPLGDASLDRAAGAAEQLAQSVKAAASIKRRPVPVAAKPENSAPVATPASDAALDHAAAASERAAQTAKTAASIERKQAQVAAKPEPEVSPQTVEEAKPAESEVAMLREPSTEIADLESERADIHGPLVLPAVPVAEAPKVETAPEPAPVAQNASMEPAPAPKQADRFKVVDSLAQYATPGPQSTRVYFGTHEIGFGRGVWQRWEPDEAPTVLAPPHVDPEIKRAALDPAPETDSEAPGVTVAPKGEVTGEGQRPRTPAERLNLVGEVRAKHEKCLSNAIYFEARGEVERGQMAVAQVILNRAFSGYYPGNVCDVVYQNAHRHLACQFTFACDNVRDVVKDQKAWALATRISSEALDGKFWLPEIGKATHYHATYVNPWWVRTMTKHSKLGIHIFYRPKRWGDGEEIPVWGDRLDVTGTITPMGPDSDKDLPTKRAAAQPARLRSIFDPVEEIKPGG